MAWLRPGLRTTLTAAVARNAASFNAQDIANTLHGLAHIKLLTTEIFKGNLHTRLKLLLTEKMLDMQFLQIQTAFCYLKVNSKMTSENFETYLRNLGFEIATLDFVKEQATGCLKKEANPSLLQKNVFDFIKTECNSVEILEEHVLEGCLIIDGYIPSKKIVIEVNGPLITIVMVRLIQIQRGKWNCFRCLG